MAAQPGWMSERDQILLRMRLEAHERDLNFRSEEVHRKNRERERRDPQEPGEASQRRWLKWMAKELEAAGDVFKIAGSISRGRWAFDAARKYVDDMVLRFDQNAAFIVPRIRAENGFERDGEQHAVAIRQYEFARSKVADCIAAAELAFSKDTVERISGVDNARQLGSSHATRAPAVKAGRPPDDAAILVKAAEMRAREMTGYDIAKQMRHEPGFEHVSTTHVRALIRGVYKGGRKHK